MRSVSWELRKCFGFSAGTHRPNLSLIAKINISLVKITLNNSQPTMQASRDASKSNCLSLSVKRAFFRFGFVGRNVQKDSIYPVIYCSRWRYVCNCTERGRILQKKDEKRFTNGIKSELVSKSVKDLNLPREAFF